MYYFFFLFLNAGSGKTYTISGLHRLVARDFFRALSTPEYKDLSISITFLEISGSRCSDLLHGGSKVTILEDAKQRVVCSGLQEEKVTTSDELLDMIGRGCAERSTHATEMNAQSSRSHAICDIILRDAAGVVKGSVSLVDLAGSERAADSKSHGAARRLESAEINKSLLALKECIRALAARGAAAAIGGGPDSASHIHVPFRASKLTLVLRDSFTSPHARLAMIATVAPAASATDHSANTLRYADRVKEKSAGAGTSGIIDDLDHDEETISTGDEFPFLATMVGNVFREKQSNAFPISSSSIIDYDQNDEPVTNLKMDNFVEEKKLPMLDNDDLCISDENQKKVVTQSTSISVEGMKIVKEKTKRTSVSSQPTSVSAPPPKISNDPVLAPSVGIPRRSSLKNITSASTSTASSHATAEVSVPSAQPLHTHVETSDPTSIAMRKKLRERGKAHQKALASNINPSITATMPMPIAEQITSKQISIPAKDKKIIDEEKMISDSSKHISNNEVNIHPPLPATPPGALSSLACVSIHDNISNVKSSSRPITTVHTGISLIKLEAEENLLDTHMRAIQECAKQITEEGHMLSRMQKNARDEMLGSDGETSDTEELDIDDYAARLEAILRVRIQTSTALLRKIARFRTACNEQGK
jgi:Kinesin motor domain